MNRKRAVPLLLVLVLVAAAAYAVHHGVSFDFHAFLRQLQFVQFGYVAAAILLIYSSYVFRAVRWHIFLRSHKRMSPMALLGPQFVGFTAVALFGRIADLSRPYLLAQKTRTTLPLQVAIYTVERMFDLGAAALIFSTALALMPRTMPHHEIFVRVGVVSLLGTLFLAAFCVGMRVAGVRIVAVVRRMLMPLSPKLAVAVEEKLLGFREGLSAVSSFSDFALAAAISITMWLLIAFSYVMTTHAFTATPSLHDLTFSRAMLLMAASLGGSLLQLPVIGWFTQIAATAAAMHAFYGTPLEPATACGAMLLIVSFVSIIPIGLIFARVDRVSLGDLQRGERVAESEFAV